MLPHSENEKDNAAYKEESKVNEQNKGARYTIWAQLVYVVWLISRSMSEEHLLSEERGSSSASYKCNRCSHYLLLLGNNWNPQTPKSTIITNCVPWQMQRPHKLDNHINHRREIGSSEKSKVVSKFKKVTSAHNAMKSVYSSAAYMCLNCFKPIPNHLWMWFGWIGMKTVLLHLHNISSIYTALRSAFNGTCMCKQRLRLRDTNNSKGHGLCNNFSWANFRCLFLMLILVCRLEHNVKNHAFQ